MFYREAAMQQIPEWLNKKIKEEYVADSEQILNGFSVSRSVSLRVNRLKTDPAEVKAELNRNGIAYREVVWYADALILESATERDIRALSLYERGEIYLQSLSSMLPPLFLDGQAGENILDMAAAPGGKTAQISALSLGGAFITACEIDRIRTDRLRFNLARQGVPRVTVLQTDARKLNEFFSFDRILLDAPCSGSGTLDLSAPIKISEALVRNSVSIQEALLCKALKLLKKNGTLVYSTCSILKEENEEVLFRALRRCGGELIPISPPTGIPVLPSADGTLCVSPDKLFEGFFVAKIQK